jgi:uncharacterized protein (DUF2237 family)
MSDPSADLPTVPDSQREAISLWMKERFDIIEREHQSRIELLRTAGEHPSPVFAGMVKRFGGLGLPKSLCAKMLGISTGVLGQHYADDYDLGQAEIISSVAANMVRIATSQGDDAVASKVGLAILERRAGDEWIPPAKRIEMNNKRNEAPIIDSSKLTFVERQALRAMLTRIANGGEGDPEDTTENDPIIE